MNSNLKKILLYGHIVFVKARIIILTSYRKVSILYLLEVFIWLLILDRKVKSQSPNKNFSYIQVLNVYKRNYLADQLKCLSSQTLMPSKIVIYQNLSFVPRLLFANFFQNIFYTHNVNWNAKYHGRFHSVLTLLEDFYIFWDDDHEPGSDWNRYTLELSARHSAVVTANGRFIDYSDDTLPDSIRQIGVEFSRKKDIENNLVVDYGGHTWTFSRKTLEDMWSMFPYNLNNSEDLHVSAAAYLCSGTVTIVPAQLLSNPSRLPDKTSLFSFHKSSDNFASHAVSPAAFSLERNSLACWWIRKGFVPVSRR